MTGAGRFAGEGETLCAPVPTSSSRTAHAERPSRREEGYTLYHSDRFGRGRVEETESGKWRVTLPAPTDAETIERCLRSLGRDRASSVDFGARADCLADLALSRGCGFFETVDRDKASIGGRGFLATYGRCEGRRVTIIWRPDSGLHCVQVASTGAPDHRGAMSPNIGRKPRDWAMSSIECETWPPILFADGSVGMVAGFHFDPACWDGSEELEETAHGGEEPYGAAFVDSFHPETGRFREGESHPYWLGDALGPWCERNGIPEPLRELPDGIWEALESGDWEAVARLAKSIPELKGAAFRWRGNTASWTTAACWERSPRRPRRRHS